MPWPLWKSILVWSSVSLAALIVLIALLVWIGIPIAFWLSLAFKRLLIFIPIQDPKNPDFANPETHGFQNVLNFYISVSDYNDNKTVTRIGAWLILHNNYSANSSDVGEIIGQTNFDILVHLHGVAANRAKPTFQYEVMRRNFMVIAVDHRGYGDSGENVEMSEDAIVNDHLQIYDWIKSKNVSSNIYYWGHSLGAALSLHTLRALKEQKNVVPKGLVLEAAFSTLAEEAVNTIIGRIFKWLPYFNATILRPLDQNGFHFYSTHNIQHVDCPIMMLHAEDDNVIPYFLGKKLASIALESRDLTRQGNVSMHIFPAKEGYGHDSILKDSSIPGLITEFRKECQEFNAKFQ